MIISFAPLRRGNLFWERTVPPTHRPTASLPKFFDYLTTPRWMPVLLFWGLVFIGLGIAYMFV